MPQTSALLGRRSCLGRLLVATGLSLAVGGGVQAEDTETASEVWSVHGQATFTWQGDAGFAAPFSGPNSLSSRPQGRETVDATLFLGVRLADGLAFYTDPEVDQGYGLNNTLGVAGFPSGEAYKIGQASPYVRLPRAFFRYVVGLGGETVTDAPAANQLGGSHAADALTFTVGKFATPDIFDTNPYAHDPRADFLNWAVVDAGAYDYAADAWGYTYGAAADWTQSWWSLRAGLFDLSRVPNTKALVRGFGQFAVMVEGEERHDLWDQPGTVKLLFFANHGFMATYNDAVALAETTGGVPDVADVRRTATRPGGGINIAQQIETDLGLFLRASLNDGTKEAFEFTDINQSLSGGLSLKGDRWARPNDTIGVAGVINALSPEARRYFADGGLGILIGDGQLPRYAPEKITEVYYRATLFEGLSLTADYQFIDCPAYDPLRGPVSVFALRAHAEF